jgi:hypothetical protein
MKFEKNTLGYILGDFFHELIWSPCCRTNEDLKPILSIANSLFILQTLFLRIRASAHGCQIFLGTTNQNGGKYTEMATENTKWQ